MATERTIVGRNELQRRERLEEQPTGRRVPLRFELSEASWRRRGLGTRCRSRHHGLWHGINVSGPPAAQQNSLVDRHETSSSAMDFLAPQVTLDPTKPFYGLVVGYLAQLHGFTELCSRGLSERIGNMPQATKSALQSANADPKTREATERIMAGGRTGLLGDQELASIAASPIKVDTDRLANALVADYQTALEHLNEVAAGGTLIVAWQITEPFHTTDPPWEFLRHCRNAAAHRGHFHLLKGQPRRTATWRGLQVAPAMHGSRLLRNPREPGFLDPADVIYLLADIEGAYPNIH